MHSMPAMARIFLHAIAAAVIFFMFQRFAVAASVQTSLIWGIAGALGAAYLAWSHERSGR